jgi:hypothetical protein
LFVFVSLWRRRWKIGRRSVNISRYRNGGMCVKTDKISSEIVLVLILFVYGIVITFAFAKDEDGKSDDEDIFKH